MRRIDLASGVMATVISVVGGRAFLQAVGNCVVWTRLLIARTYKLGLPRGTRHLENWIQFMWNTWQSNASPRNHCSSEHQTVGGR